MAWDFADQIHALTGYDADSSDDTDTGEDFNVLTNQWLTEAAKEVVGILSGEFQEKCIVSSTLNDVNTTFNFATTLSSGGATYSPGRLIAVTRSDGNYNQLCRQVSVALSSRIQDANDIMHYASTTDPAYYVKSDIVNVFPVPTSAQNAEVLYLANPVVSYDDTVIPNFPSEAEPLVVLRAAMTATEYLLAIEEDVELYGPILANIKSQYKERLMMLTTGSVVPPQAQQQRGR